MDSKEVLVKSLSVTSTYINSSLAVDQSTGAVSAVGPLDTIVIEDASVPAPSVYDRKRTSLTIDYDRIPLVFGDEPYKAEWDAIRQAVKNFEGE